MVLPRFLVVMVFSPTTCSAPAPRTSWQLLELKCCETEEKLQEEVVVGGVQCGRGTPTFNRSDRRVSMSVAMDGMSLTH